MRGLKEPLTREQFEAGHPFIVYQDSLIGSLIYLPPAPERRLDHGALRKNSDDSSVCNVSKVDKNGFYWYTYFLGKSIKGRVLFSDCIPFKS